MVESTDSINILRYLFEKDYENKLCAECKAPMPNLVSINNAILLCENCGKKHSDFEQKLKTKIMEYYRLLVSKYFINFLKNR